MSNRVTDQLRYLGTSSAFNCNYHFKGYGNVVGDLVGVR